MKRVNRPASGRTARRSNERRAGRRSPVGVGGDAVESRVRPSVEECWARRGSIQARPRPLANRAAFHVARRTVRRRPTGKPAQRSGRGGGVRRTTGQSLLLVRCGRRSLCPQLAARGGSMARTANRDAPRWPRTVMPRFRGRARGVGWMAEPGLRTAQGQRRGLRPAEPTLFRWPGGSASFRLVESLRVRARCGMGRSVEIRVVERVVQPALRWWGGSVAPPVRWTASSTLRRRACRAQQRHRMSVRPALALESGRRRPMIA